MKSLLMIVLIVLTTQALAHQSVAHHTHEGPFNYGLISVIFGLALLVGMLLFVVQKTRFGQKALIKCKKIFKLGNKY